MNKIALALLFLLCQKPVKAQDSLSVDEKARQQRDLKILLNLPEEAGQGGKKNQPPVDSAKAAAPAPETAMDLGSPVYQKGLALFKNALQEYLNGNYQKATDQFKQVMEIDPLHKNAFEYLTKARAAVENQANPGFLIEKAQAERNIKNELVFQVGLEAYLNGDYPEAMRVWRELIQQAPDFKKAFLYVQEAENKLSVIAENFLEQGLYYYRKGDAQKALAEWENGLGHAPGNERLLAQIELIRRQASAQAGESKARQEARARADREIKEGTAKATALFNGGKYEQAREAFVLLLEMSPDDPVIRDYAAQSQRKAALQARQGELDTAFREGASALENGNFGVALDLFSQIGKVDADYPGLKEKRSAAESGAREIQRRKNLSQAFNKGLNDFQKGSYQSALKEWTAALKDNPDNEMLKQYVQEADNLIKSQGARKAAAEKGRQAAFDMNRDAITLYKKKKFSEAFQKLDSARALDPENDAILKGIKTIKKEMIREEENRTPLSEKEAESLFHEGIGFYRSGDYKKAIQCWQKVMSIKPDHVKAQKYIENVNKKLEKIEKI